MLILSLFPGIGLLDKAFEEEGFCIVRGPDVLWGGDIKRFHPPSAVFSGVIGGPPCQAFSQLVHMVIHTYGADKVAPNLIPEFERCIWEAQPDWFLMENVPNAPLPCVAGYCVHAQVFNNRWCGGEQNRERRISFGTRDGRRLDIPGEVFQPVEYATAVLASGSRANGVAIRFNKGGKPKRLDKMSASRQSVSEALRLQGLPDDFFAQSPLTIKGKQHVLGNGVPLPLGRTVARAVKEAIQWK